MMASPHTLSRASSSLVRDPGQRRLHLRAGRGAARRTPSAARRPGGLPGGPPRQDIHGSGFDLDLIVHAGAGAYICGEETALLDSLEGRRGQPRLRPPFPAVAGLYASPTVINNVESIASVPSIIDNGPEWFAWMGTEKSKGYGIFSLSGPRHPARPVRGAARHHAAQLIDLAGGVREGHRLKFWTPGGSSTPLLTDEHLDVPLDFEGVAAAGSMLGTRALQIFDDTTCVVRAVLRWTEFYKHESCGKCTPCREGTWWLVQCSPSSSRARAARPTRAAARPVRQRPRRAPSARWRRRGSARSQQLDPVLPRRVPRPPHRGGCPFDPGASTLFAPRERR